VVVDNSFLAIGIHTGVIGLMLWLAIIWYVWAYMLAQSQKVLTPVRAAAAGAWSVCLFTSVFNVTLFLPLPFAMFLLSKKQWGTRVAPVQPAGISRQVHQRSVGTLEGRLMDGPA
jgi:riboflavin transporter FmnP